MDDPQYVVLVVLDEPKPEKGTGRHRRLNAAPTVATVIARRRCSVSSRVSTCQADQLILAKRPPARS